MDMELYTDYVSYVYFRLNNTRAEVLKPTPASRTSRRSPEHRLDEHNDTDDMPLLLASGVSMYDESLHSSSRMLISSSALQIADRGVVVQSGQAFFRLKKSGFPSRLPPT